MAASSAREILPQGADIREAPLAEAPRFAYNAAFMRALHVFANWKWTGPAELAVNACRGLVAAGVEARFACGRAPGDEPSVADRARERGIEPVLPELRLAKHVRYLANWRDARVVARYVAEEAIDVLHAHLPNDHAIAAAALAGNARARLVRTCYDGERLPRTWRQRRALAATDALIAVSQAALEDATGALGFPADRAFRLDAPIDTGRFDPARALPDMRPRLDLRPDDFVLGIVARMQWHRRFDVFLEGLARAAARIPGLRAVVIGRGTNQDPVAKEPARALGLEPVIRFPGYLEGDEYVGALAALDAKIFLVPGSDGSCRAVREAMAMGKPVIAARRGMLPEIVADGRTGIVIEDDAGGIAAAIERLAADRAATRAMGTAAREEARARFSIERAAAELVKIYEGTLAKPRRA
jgi:glycosyltransferase involved in cell wall biosynthesis